MPGGCFVCIEAVPDYPYLSRYDSPQYFPQPLLTGFWFYCEVCCDKVSWKQTLPSMWCSLPPVGISETWQDMNMNAKSLMPLVSTTSFIKRALTCYSPISKFDISFIQIIIGWMLKFIWTNWQQSQIDDASSWKINLKLDYNWPFSEAEWCIHV